MDIKKILFGICIATTMLTTFIVATVKPQQAAMQHMQQGPDNISHMPIADTHPLAMFGSNQDPIPQRDESVRKYIQAGLKISVPGSSGSGTIVYYDAKENLAYVQSCGHLFNGNMSAEQGKNRNASCKVTTWYNNMTKLDKPKTFDAKVLFYNNGTGRDISLITFKPDWVPEYFPIAPDNQSVPPNMPLMSIGCDHSTEIAGYDVKVVKLESGQFPELVTTDNSPRPGRSGGGLLTRDGYYVGICVRTSDVTGHGIGLFTPLQTIRYFNKINGYDWLNEVGMNWARQLPVVDRNGKQQEYPKDYIPLPSSK